MKKLLLALTLTISSFITLMAQSPIGTWKTIDDKIGKAKSHVEIYEKNGKIYGKVVDLLLKPDDTLCTKCDDHQKDKPVVGMVIVNGLSAQKGYWKNGTILDPASGSYYGCSMWFKDGNTDELQVRGKHWTGIYRTQTWYRI